MSHTRILIVHADPSIAALMTSMLQTLGHKIDEAPNDRAAVRMLEHSPVDLVLAGADPDDADALEFLSYLRRKAPNVPVILLFPTPHPERMREAQVRGAAAVLRFPVSANVLRAAVAQALGLPETAGTVKPSAPASSLQANAAARAATLPALSGGGHGHGHGAASGGPNPVPAHGSGHARLRFEMAMAATPLDASPSAGSAREPGMLVGEDPALVQAIELAGTIAASRGPVLIVGERGAGKTLLARSLHLRGAHPEAPFVEVVCGTMTEDELQADLFGQGAAGFGDPERPGKVALARGGTLYIDEVASLSPGLQVKILRLLCDGEYELPGSGRVEKANVRLVLGTREDLPSLVASGRFRMDLHYRMSVVTLKLPPLRHRGSDIDRLADHFRVVFARQHGKDIRSLSPETLDVLRSHGWPGNVQELEQVIERAVIVCRGARIEPNHLALIPRDLSGLKTAPGRPQRARLGADILPLKEALEEPEKQLILQALEALNWNRQETARVLDINRTTLYKKMKKYGLLFDEPVWAN